MRAGVSTASLFMRLYNEDALPLLDEWGVGETEVFLTSFCEYLTPFAQKLAARKGKVNVHSVHVINTQFEPQLYAAHPRTRGDAFRWLEETMRSAQILGAKYYTFHGIARIKRTFRENLPRVAEGTVQIAETCKKYGVTLAYENVEWAIFNHPDVFPVLKAAVPTLAGVLDLKQARLSGYDWREYLAGMGESISHVHVSDISADGKMCLPGRGVFDFDELFRRLADAGFHGPLLIENYRDDFADLGELKAAYEFLAEKAEKYAVK